jgi:hypothetical protein
MNPIQKKMYRLIGDAGVLNRNMFTGRAQADWQALAECPDREMYEYKVRKTLVEDFCHKTSKRLIPKITDGVHGREWSMLGFIFSEEEIIELLYAAYLLGRDEGTSTYAIGGVLNEVREKKGAVMAAICSAPFVDNED